MARTPRTPHDAADAPVSIGVFRNLRLKANGQGYWEIWWTDARGYVTRRESCRTKIRTEAEAYLREFCENARQFSQQVTRRQRTVEDLCSLWVQYAEDIGKTRSGQYALVPIRKNLGRCTIDELTDDRFDLYRNQRKVSGSSIRRELGALRTVLLWAADRNPPLLEHSALPSFRRDRMPKAGAPRILYLDREQEAAFWQGAVAWGAAPHKHPQEAAAARRVALFVALALATSARRGAIHDLTWDRVDLKGGFIHYKNPGRAETNKRRATVPISARLLPVLQAAWATAPKDAAGQAYGRVVDAPDVRKGFRAFTEVMGMSWVTPHVLRHTYATLATIEGVALAKIAAVMADNPVTVVKNYIHLTPGYLRDAVDHLGVGGVVGSRVEAA